MYFYHVYVYVILDETVKSILCAPIVTPQQECIAVIELCRDVTSPPFSKENLKIVVVVTGWMGAAIHQNQERLALQKQQELNDYLLDLTKCYFAEVVALDHMINEVVVSINFACNICMQLNDNENISNYFPTEFC